ncbi:hypothetical protein CIG75_07110 [Tumebacillus algifaecis]|uniref:Helix-hairpin-helix DNA-binding motif class 1 domain-containing protein n=1 Tax=Tumebacillus algifaecis TaxID=1214604 RepID=A0A223D0A1_9BACL|nr:ComEA family DNA-binding protein [Tumebacillus algifaecis]ASS74766.1 hypothetical protein CIG75_07110 [Tumebacillus algifaecis]
MQIQKKERTLLLVLLIGILLAGSVYLYGDSSKLQADGIVLEQASAQPSVAAEKIKVHVKGEVNSPGVYQLPPDSRVIDAIEAAGGSKAEAHLDGINLAQALADGGQVMVPPQPTLQDTAQTSPTQGQPHAGKINLNTATLEQLVTLPGIGSVRAQAILDHRQNHGRFFQAEDLKKISGISVKLFDQLRDKVYVE